MYFKGEFKRLIFLTLLEDHSAVLLPYNEPFAMITLIYLLARNVFVSHQKNNVDTALRKTNYYTLSGIAFVLPILG